MHDDQKATPCARDVAPQQRRTTAQCVADLEGLRDVGTIRYLGRALLTQKLGELGVLLPVHQCTPAKQPIFARVVSAEIKVAQKLIAATHRSSMRGSALVCAAVLLDELLQRSTAAPVTLDPADTLHRLGRFLEASLTHDDPEALWLELGLPPVGAK